MSDILLSKEARQVLGGCFGFGQVLTYHMIESIPSPEMQSALDELVLAGMLKREEGLPDMTQKAVRYRAAEGIDMMPFKREVWDNLDKEDCPKIRVYIPKPAC
jgi:hypothetical protein